jgi:hypothetical protein
MFCFMFEIKSKTADTINFTDSNCKKQGHWIITGKDKLGMYYKPEQKAEEGRCKDNLKTGIWVEYWRGSGMKNIFTFGKKGISSPEE